MAAGRTTLGVTAHYNHDVPLRRHRQDIMVEITGPSTRRRETAELDLVVVLDTSGSMRGQKLADMKQAAKFVIQKIGEMDTLVFVPFSDRAREPSNDPPLHMSEQQKSDARSFVQDLTARGNTNIERGLLAAIDILHGRTDRTGRAAGIFLMSDGLEHRGNARNVRVADFPVFTFGFGRNHDKQLLHDIARRSHGGTYHNTPHSPRKNTLLQYFARVLGILRDVSALNVEVTLNPRAGATITDVDPGNYRFTSSRDGSFTIHFGELAREEHRKIIVEIKLPTVHINESARTVMAVECTYRLPGERERRNTHNITMARTRNARPVDPSEPFMGELTRRDHADRIRDMKRLADDRRLRDARNDLAEARNAVRIMQSAGHCLDLMDALSKELEQLRGLLVSHEVYNQHGVAYILAAILSHGRQRFAARGHPDEDDVDLYTLPRMLKYSRQADNFHNDEDI